MSMDDVMSSIVKTALNDRVNYPPVPAAFKPETFPPYPPPPGRHSAGLGLSARGAHVT